MCVCVCFCVWVSERVPWQPKFFKYKYCGCQIHLYNSNYPLNSTHPVVTLLIYSFIFKTATIKHIRKIQIGISSVLLADSHVWDHCSNRRVFQQELSECHLLWINAQYLLNPDQANTVGGLGVCPCMLASTHHTTQTTGNWTFFICTLNPDCTKIVNSRQK